MVDYRRAVFPWRATWMASDGSIRTGMFTAYEQARWWAVSVTQTDGGKAFISHVESPRAVAGS